MGKLFQGIILIVTTSFLTGCGNLNSIHHFLTVDEGTGAMVDIKQRAIMVSKKQIEKTDEHGYSQKTQTIVCAEPSPDALSAYAAELAAEGGIPGKVTAKLAGATQESAAFVGLRTQSIQLLRDSLYRLCEGYMSGALTKTEYGHYTRRYQRFMIALLGIEQLTGAIRAPSVTIQTQGKAQAAVSIADMRNEIKQIDEDIKEKTKSKDAFLVKQQSETDEKKKEDIQKEIDAVVTAIKEKENDKEDIKKAISEERKELVAGGSTTTLVSGVGLPTSRSDSHIQHVASVVENIVLRAMDVDDLGPFCWDFLMHHKTNKDKQPPSDSTQTTQASFYNTLFVSQEPPDHNPSPLLPAQKVTEAPESNIPDLRKICLMRLAQNDLNQDQARKNIKALFDLYTSNLNALTPQERVKALRPALEQQQSSDLQELHPDLKPVGPVPPWLQKPNGPTLARAFTKESAPNFYGSAESSHMYAMNTIQAPQTPPVWIYEASYVAHDAPTFSVLKTEINKKYSDKNLALCSLSTSSKVECLPGRSFTIQEMSEAQFAWLVSRYIGPTEQFRFLWTTPTMLSIDSQTGK